MKKRLLPPSNRPAVNSSKKKYARSDKHLFLEYVKAYNAKDVDHMLTFFHEACVFENISAGKVTVRTKGKGKLAARRMEDAVQNLSQHSARPGALKEFLKISLRELRWGTPPGLVWLIRLLDAVAVQARARLPRDLLLFRKSLLTLEGMLAGMASPDSPDLNAGQTVADGALIEGLLAQLAKEFPERLQQPIGSRPLATHFSTADLLAFLSPATFGRYWMGAWEDILMRITERPLTTVSL